MCSSVRKSHSRSATDQYLVVADPFPLRTQKLGVPNNRRAVLGQQHPSYAAASLRPPLSCLLLASGLPPFIVELFVARVCPCIALSLQGLPRRRSCQTPGMNIAVHPLPTPETLAELSAETPNPVYRIYTGSTEDDLR